MPEPTRFELMRLALDDRLRVAIKSRIDLEGIGMSIQWIAHCTSHADGDVNCCDCWCLEASAQRRLRKFAEADRDKWERRALCCHYFSDGACPKCGGRWNGDELTVEWHD